MTLQVFVALAQQIKGISKKGKEFFEFNSNLTETITSLFVEDLKIWTSAFVHTPRHHSQRVLPCHESCCVCHHSRTCGGTHHFMAACVQLASTSATCSTMAATHTSSCHLIASMRWNACMSLVTRSTMPCSDAKIGSSLLCAVLRACSAEVCQRTDYVCCHCAVSCVWQLRACHPRLHCCDGNRSRGSRGELDHLQLRRHRCGCWCGSGCGCTHRWQTGALWFPNGCAGTVARRREDCSPWVRCFCVCCVRVCGMRGGGCGVCGVWVCGCVIPHAVHHHMRAACCAASTPPSDGAAPPSPWQVQTDPTLHKE